MGKVKRKTNNLQITTDAAGKEKIRFKGKFVKKLKVDRHLRGKMLSEMRKKSQSLKNSSVEKEKIDIPVDGERVVNFDCMAKKMFCSKCNHKLHLTDIIDECVQGLGSIFHVKCEKCSHVNKVESSEKYVDSAKGVKLFAINSKVALGALNSGFGATKANKFLKVIGLPGLNEKPFKVHERFVGPVIEQVAKESCIKVVLEEKELTEKNIDELKLCLSIYLTNGVVKPFKNLAVI
ncbi:Mutator-like transposase domain-containing protein [Camponotus japonicus]